MQGRTSSDRAGRDAPRPALPRGPGPWGTVLIAVALTALSLSLRMTLLGGTFQSADNAELAVQVLYNPGYEWMTREPYGVLINVLAKLFAGTASALGVTVTEFLWRVPVALIGSLHAAVAYLFLRRLRAGSVGALLGGLAIAVLPVHVMQSRYLWGYEVLGAFTLTLAMWALIAFLKSPRPLTAAAASGLSALYLLSHGYFFPFAGCLVAVTAVFGPGEGVPERLRGGAVLLVRKLVWVGPSLAFPLYWYALAHALTRRARAGFYLPEHAWGFLGNVGWPLALCFAAALALSVRVRTGGRPVAGLLGVCGLSYLVPLMLAAPPGVTMVRGYMLVGITLLVLCAAVAAGEVGRAHPRPVLVAGALCLALTLWGTVESVFWLDRLPDPSLVAVERGGVRLDPGSKAAGYVVRKHVPSSAVLLAVHPAVEPPNLFYYFGRVEYAFYDFTEEQLLRRLTSMRAHMDVVICEPAHKAAMEGQERFPHRLVIMSRGEPVMWICTTREVELPCEAADAEELNRAFDREFAPRVRLW